MVTPDEINSLFVKNTPSDSTSSSSNGNKVTPSNSKNTRRNDINLFGESISTSSDDTNSFDDEEQGDSDSDEKVGSQSGGLTGFANSLKEKLTSAYNKAASNVEMLDDERNDEETSFFQQSSSSSTTTSTATSTSAISSYDSNNDEDDARLEDAAIPQWLVNADKDAEKAKKALKNKRKKKITDDWRFWASIIATIGFATAFYQVYQQTGGFSPDITPFSSIGADILNGKGTTGGDELII